MNLHAAVLNGDTLLVAEILRRNPEQLSHCNMWGWTPLHVAAYRADLAVARLLVEAGADLASRDERGFTALGLAREVDPRNPVIALLQERGASY